MAKRRVAPGRRSIIAALLIGFVLVTIGVISRRVLGLQVQREIRDLRRQRDGLDAERVRLEAAIRDASSRATLQPIAEQRLNMHIPTPDQQVFLTRPTRTPADSGRAPHDSL